MIRHHPASPGPQPAVTRHHGGVPGRQDQAVIMRYDGARVSLDRHATYIVAAYIAGAAR